MKKTKKRFSSDYHTKIWNPIFSTDRIPNEAKSYVEGRRGHQAKGEGIALFLYDSENSKSCKTQVVEDFCHDVRLEDIRRGSGNAGRRRAAWLDDRCKANGAPAGGHVRTYKNPMTPTAVLRHMEEVRFGNEGLPDAERRLFYVPNLDPNYVTVLAETAPDHQVPVLRDAIRKHLAMETSIRVMMPGHKCYRVFQMEMHVPFFALRKHPTPSAANLQTAEGYRKPKRRWTDLSVLTAQISRAEDEAKFGIYESRFSFVICGSDNRRWIGYAFVDQDDDEENLGPEDCHYEGFQEDPIAAAAADANMPEWEPRQYFLNVLESRIKLILREWENVVYTVERRIKEYESRHSAALSQDCGAVEDPSTKSTKEVFNWTQSTTNLLNNLLGVISETLHTWERFQDHNGDIGYFEDSTSAASSEFSSERAQLSFQIINETFEELESLQAKLLSMKESCENSTKSLTLRLRYESNAAVQQTGLTTYFTLLVPYPFALATAFIAMPREAVPFTRSFRSFVISIFGFMALFLLLYLALDYVSRRSWWRKGLIALVKDLHRRANWKKGTNPSSDSENLNGRPNGPMSARVPTLEEDIEMDTYAGGIEMHTLVV